MAGDGLGLRILRAILKALPRSDAKDYGEEALDTARELRRDLGDAPFRGRARYWIREWSAALSAVAAAWLDELRSRRATNLASGGFWFDLRTVVRSLAKRKLFTVSAVATLALGIGANAGVTAVAWTLLFSPLPYPESEQLVRIFHAPDLSFGVSLDELAEYNAQSSTLEGAAGWSQSGANQSNDGTSVRVSLTRVTPNLLSVLQRRPLYGRDFAATDERVVILSHRYWMTRFSGAASMIGRSIQLNDLDYEVIGVLPPDLTFPLGDADLLTAYTPRAPSGWRSGPFVDVVARTAATETLERARAEIGLLADAMRAREPKEYEAEPDFGGFVVPLGETRAESHRSLLLALIAATTTLFVATCLNIATLFTTRLEERSAEMYVRRAIGATAGALVRLHLTEAMLVGLAGSLAGLIVASWTTSTLAPVVGGEWVGAGGVDGGTLALWVALAGGLSTVLVVAPLAFPALRMAKRERPTSDSRVTMRTLRGLGVAQVALALTLLIGSVQILKTVRTLAAVDLGYSTSDVLTARVSLPAARFPTAADQVTFFGELVERGNTLPSVLKAAVVSASPLSDVGGGGDIYVEEASPDSAVDIVSQRIVTSGYFDVLQIPLLAGRTFDATDRAGDLRVAIVDEAFAREYFGDPGSAIGKRVRFFFGGEDWNRVVGVVGHVRTAGPARTERMQVYVPFAQRPTRQAHAVLAFAGNVDGAIRDLRGLVAALDPTLPLYDVLTLERRLAGILQRERIALSSFSGFALVALFLAALGTYGTVALTQKRRSREIAIRRVLGATPKSALLLVATGGLQTIAIGIAAGGLVSLVLSRQLEAALPGVIGFDVGSVAVGAAVVAGAGVAAAFLPARRAVHSHPTDVLRD